jgi:hypothetical protein
MTTYAGMLCQLSFKAAMEANNLGQGQTQTGLGILVYYGSQLVGFVKPSSAEAWSNYSLAVVASPGAQMLK